MRDLLAVLGVFALLVMCIGTWWPAFKFFSSEPDDGYWTDGVAEHHFDTSKYPDEDDERRGRRPNR